MKLKLLTALMLATFTAQALDTKETTAITAALRSTRVPELPFVAAKIVREAKPEDRKQVEGLVLGAVIKQQPSALAAVRAALRAQTPAENRPPVTPGNENGNRPEVPPGLDKQDYGKP